MSKKAAPAEAAKPRPAAGFTASVQVLTLPAGLYLFSVSTGTPGKAGANGLRLPALHVAVGPGTPQERVQFMPGNVSSGPWLSTPGDLLAIKVNAPGAVMLVSSVRGEGGAELAIKLDKLDSSTIPAPKPVAPAPMAAPVARGPGDGPRLQIGTHVRNRGDLNFTDTEWAGKLGQGFWLESFSVIPLEQFTRQDIEYKGLTASGFESPWLSNGASCGTRGMATPLIGFAIRLKSGVGNGDWDCEYSGYYQSGVVVGPLKNGTPCLSTVANDPLEGIQVRLVNRKAVIKPAAPKTAPKPAAKPLAKPAKGKAKRK